jgi:hypothetical protein
LIKSVEPKNCNKTGERLRMAGIRDRSRRLFMRSAAVGVAVAVLLSARARDRAQARIDALGIENSRHYQKVWASDFLTDDQLKRFITCISEQRPGLWIAGRPEATGVFRMVFAHDLPVGVEKITLRVVAHDNIANIDEFKAYLKGLGERTSLPVQAFSLRLADPAQRAVLIVRAGFEIPVWLYIPVYPAPDVR